MSFANNVKAALNTAINNSITTIILNNAVAPFSNPPLTGGKIILTDSLANPTQFEIIDFVRGTTGGGTTTLIGCVRGREGTTAASWSAGTTAFMSLSAEQAEGFSKATHLIDLNGGDSSTVFWDLTINCGASN